MERDMTGQESLKVINSMIAQARNQVKKGDGKYFLIWGYIVALASLAHFAWMKIDYPVGVVSAGWLWIGAIILGAIITMAFAMKDKQREVVKTYTGSIGSSVWLGFGICCIAIFALLGGKYGAFIYPAISFVYTYALFLIAKIYRLKWLYCSVAAGIVIVVLYKFIGYVYFPLLMAVIIIIGNILPGHYINSKATENV